MAASFISRKKHFGCIVDDSTVRAIISRAFRRRHTRMNLKFALATVLMAVSFWELSQHDEAKWRPRMKSVVRAPEAL